MLLLTSTDKVELVTSAAVTLDYYACWVDATAAGPPVVQGDTAGRTANTVNAAQDTDLVAAPAGSELRNVKTINVRNRHASTSCDVTFQIDVSGTEYELFKCTLRAGETVQYKEGLGWYVVAAADVLRTRLLAADQSNSTSTPTEVTGLSLTTGLGTFWFRYLIVARSAATTTGHKFSANHAGTVSTFVYWVQWLTAATTASDDVPDQDHVAAPGGVFSGFSARAKTTAGTGTTTDVDTADADILYLLEGTCVVTADGELELWHGSDVAAASTVKAGTSVFLQKIG